MVKAYLTQEEYDNYGFEPIAEMFSFDNLLLRATLILDNITRHFYVNHDIEKDSQWRADKFKKALSMQIEYFIVNEAFTSSQLNDRPLTVQIGRTSISKKGKGQYATNESDVVELVCPDVYIALEGTGLLYRGVETC